MFLTGDAMQWHKLTLNFEGPTLSEEPETFLDHRLDVTFTHEDGTEVTIPGFFAADGDASNTGATSGNVWQVNFNPPMTGDWTWEASFRVGDEISVSQAQGQSGGFFDGDNGSLSISESDKTGDDFRAKGVLEYDGGQYLSYAGTGETFLKSGVGSPENFLGYSGFDDTPGSHDYAPHIADFNAGDPTWDGGKGQGIIGAVNYLAEHEVNSAYMMLMNIAGDGRDVSPWTDTSLYNINKNASPDLDERAQSFDVSKLAQWEIVFGHMQEKGVNLHLFLQETENDQLLNDGALGTERMLYMREMVARFGHHNSLIWNLGEENTNTTAEIRDHSEYLKALDPYDHAVALHTYPNQHNKYEAYEGSETLDVLSFQTSNESQVPDLDRYLDGADDAGRPVVAFLDEPGNASIGLAAEGDPGWEANHAALREVLWKSYAEGAGGAEWYYGYQSANGQGGDLAMEDFSLRESAYEWAASAREFFEKLPLEDMRDGDALTSGTETHGLALDGTVYAYYLPDGGTASLDLSGQGGTYSIGWYDVIEGGPLTTGSVASVSGGGVQSLGAPPTAANGEWAVVIWNPAQMSFDVGDGPMPPDMPDVPTPPPTSDLPDITLRLVDAGTDETLGVFEAGDTIDASVIGDKDISIVADVAGSVGSVRLTLGEIEQVENVAPYALFGDTGGDFAAGKDAAFDAEGDYTLKVELFAGQNASGGKIGEIETGFSVGDTGSPPTPAPPEPEPDPTPMPPEPEPEPTPPAPTSDALWAAQDGKVVMQAEKGVPTDPNGDGYSNWQISDDLGGHTGDGYLHWDGPNLYNEPGSGALSYEFEVTEGGSYKLGLLGSRPANGERSDLNNDFFVRMDGGPWKKVFFGGARETWNWGKTFDVNHDKSPAEYDLEPGTHVFEISGRSEDAYLDKIHLSLGSLDQNKAAAETLAETPTTPDTPPVPDTPPEPDVPSVPDEPPQDPPPAPDVPPEPDTPDVPDTPPEAPDDPLDPTTVWLVDSASDTRLFELGENTVLHSSVAAGRSLTLGAEVDESVLAAKSAVLTLDGGDSQIENVEPYALFGDRNGNYQGEIAFDADVTQMIEIEYFAGNGASGGMLRSETLGLEVDGNDKLSARADEADLFGVDTSKMGEVSIHGFSPGDQIADVGEGLIDLLSNGEKVGDDWVLDYGSGNKLTLLDYDATEDPLLI